MNAKDIIREVEEQAGEWLEMHENPAELVAGILAHKVVALSNYIEYLEKRVGTYEQKSISNIRN